MSSDSFSLQTTVEKGIVPLLQAGAEVCQQPLGACGWPQPWQLSAGVPGAVLALCRLLGTVLQQRTGLCAPSIGPFASPGPSAPVQAPRQCLQRGVTGVQHRASGSRRSRRSPLGPLQDATGREGRFGLAKVSLALLLSWCCLLPG